MPISDSDVIAELTTSGAKVEDYFLVGNEICLVNRHGEFMSLLIEDVEGETEGEMHFAIQKFLRRIGAKSYGSHDEYHQRAQT